MTIKEDKIMKKAKKETWPKHKMGKFYGYDENEDGSIIVAPGLAEIMEKAVEEEAAISAASSIFNKLMVDLLKDVNQKKKDFWDRIIDEYGLEKITQYTYQHATRTVMVKEKVSP